MLARIGRADMPVYPAPLSEALSIRVPQIPAKLRWRPPAYCVRLGRLARLGCIRDPGSLKLEDLDIAAPSVDLRRPLAERSAQIIGASRGVGAQKAGGSMHQSTSTGSLDLPSLSAAERLFIWGFRAKARSGSAVPTAADIQQVYDHFRVGDAVPSLESIIEIFACTAHTAIEVHCPTCPKMSDSEHGCCGRSPRRSRNASTSRASSSRAGCRRSVPIGLSRPCGGLQRSSAWPASSCPTDTFSLSTMTGRWR